MGQPSAPAITTVTFPLGTGSPDAGLDDADALPAVGKVWDSGPKRSLSSMFAAAAKPKESPAPASQGGETAVVVAPQLQAAWNTLLATVKEQIGPVVHVPLVSGEPRRKGDVLVVRFSGPFATMGRLLEKYRDQLQQLFCQITGENLGLQFEMDESAPAPKMMPQTPRSGGNAENAPAPSPAAASVIMAAAKEGIPLTPELRAQLEQDPLLRALLEGFSGNIVRVE